MSFLLVNITSSLKSMCSAVTQFTKSHPKLNTSSQLEMRVLIAKLDSLLLLESIKLYHSNWNELKIKVTQLAAEQMININNQHVMKLTQTIEVLVINQKKLMSAASIFYVITLKDMLVWSDSSIIKLYNVKKNADNLKIIK